MTKILCVLDGCGLSINSENNVTCIAKMPNFRGLLKKYWWTTLNADGDCVGQEEGLVGNSEVGHMNLGGLGLIKQLSYQITQSAANNFDLSPSYPNQLFDPKLFLKDKFADSENNKVVHLIGLFSTGSIHSDLRHWVGSIEAAGLSGAEKIVLHLISDGRDSDRQSLLATWEYFLNQFEARLQPYQNKIFLGSVGGRFYSMDRDDNWDRVARGIFPMIEYKGLEENVYNSELLKNLFQSKYNVNFDAILEGEKLKLEKENRHFETEEEYQEFGHKNFHVLTNQHYFFNKKDETDRVSLGPLKTDIKWMLEYYSKENYSKEIYDEFILPCNWYYLPIGSKTRPFCGISKNDTVWLLNFRTDRMKQFATMLCGLNQELSLNLNILANNSYGIRNEIFLDENLSKSKNIIPKDFNPETYREGGYFPIFKNQPVVHPLAEKISQTNKTQLHIAETEKYNHVTYFFNGGQDKKWEGEKWHVIDSNKVNSHAEKPEMKAKEITDYILEEGLGKYDYIIVNYANPDMLGHTGDIPAAIKSMEFLDEQLGRLVVGVEAGGHKMLITADHGNIEMVGKYIYKHKNLTDTEHNANPVPCIIVDPEFEVAKLMNNITDLSKEYNLHVNLEKIKQVLEGKDNRIDLDSYSVWLEENDIPKPHWPLWYAGLIVFGM